MSSMSQAAVVHRPISFTGRNGPLDKYFYFAMSLLVAAIVVWGFSHSIDSNLLHAAVPRPLILWIHAAAFSGWVVFYILQFTLVRTHRVRWHRTLGWFGAALGISMVLLGVVTAIAMGRFRTHVLHEVGADLFEIVPFTDMLNFGMLFGLGIYWRTKPQLHRRLILIATCCLLNAAFGRFDYIFQHNLFFAGVDAVILLGVGRDLLVDRRIHPVYRVALPLLLLVQAFTFYVLLRTPAWWVRVAHGLMG